MRDDFEKKTIEVLIKRVGNRCSNPNCRQLTSGPHTTVSKSINIGVAAHITAASKNGPRFDAKLTTEERRHIDNGIWLCQSCSKLIDSDTERYSSDILREWKRLSEQAALYEVENRELNKLKSDVEIIQFYSTCFDRPAFQDYFAQEASIEAFDQALEDTIIALNTGTLRDRNGTVLRQSKGKSYIENTKWRDQISLMVDLLRTMRGRYNLAVKQGDIRLQSRNKNYYDIVNRELYEWFDKSRQQLLELFGRVCIESGVKWKSNFPRHKKYY